VQWCEEASRQLCATAEINTTDEEDSDYSL